MKNYMKKHIGNRMTVPRRGAPYIPTVYKGSPRRGTYKELLPLEEWGVRHACP